MNHNFTELFSVLGKKDTFKGNYSFLPSEITHGMHEDQEDFLTEQFGDWICAKQISNMRDNEIKAESKHIKNSEKETRQTIV